MWQNEKQEKRIANVKGNTQATKFNTIPNRKKDLFQIIY